MRLNESAVTWREVDSEIVALNVHAGVYFTLNGSGRLLWLALADSASVDELADLLVVTYGVPEEQARIDASAFVDDLVGRSLVEADA